MALPSIAKLSIDDLKALRAVIDKRLIDERTQIEEQLSRFPMGASNGHVMDGRSKLKGSKVAPKYRSKKDRSLTWAGRGQTPTWMVAEMKAGKLKKEAFLIK
jgi:DNA-binding protein H-NS